MVKWYIFLVKLNKNMNMHFLMYNMTLIKNHSINLNQVALLFGSYHSHNLCWFFPISTQPYKAKSLKHWHNHKKNKRLISCCFHTSTQAQRSWRLWLLPPHIKRTPKKSWKVSNFLTPHTNITTKYNMN